eukprot:NODE_2199_length_2268_cov_4.057917.p1 GENE.NODE_2199_length_2268_cov_4.057917~~NODE_2199_length_2268_cov_4.057917.p1  ORF type:complete len:691 (-),score=123.70 NODE_2199_length_2268_cov_4.057917:195-2060(-)
MAGSPRDWASMMSESSSDSDMGGADSNGNDALCGDDGGGGGSDSPSQHKAGNSAATDETTGTDTGNPELTERSLSSGSAGALVGGGGGASYSGGLSPVSDDATSGSASRLFNAGVVVVESAEALPLAEGPATTVGVSAVAAAAVATSAGPGSPAAAVCAPAAPAASAAASATASGASGASSADTATSETCGSVERWGQGLAQHLCALAVAVPELTNSPSRQTCDDRHHGQTTAWMRQSPDQNRDDAACCTDLVITDLDRLKARAAQLHELSERVAKVEEEAMAEERQAYASECRRAQLSVELRRLLAKRTLAERTAPERAAESTTFPLPAAGGRHRTPSEVLAVVKAQKLHTEELRASIAHRRAEFCHLRKATLPQVLARAEARLHASEEEVARVSEECEELRSGTEAARADLEAAKKNASTRKARAEHLENQCQELSSSLADVPCSPHAGVKTSTQRRGLLRPRPTLEEELASAKEENMKLLANVREARSERDQLISGLVEMHDLTKKTMSKCEAADEELANLQEKTRSLRERQSLLDHEVERRRQEVRHQEECSQRHESSTVSAMRKHSEVDQKARECVLAQKCIEESNIQLEHRLSNVLARMHDHATPICRAMLPTMR